MLITEININFKAGDGGDGKVSFRKGKKGPDGGNGGKGGSVFIAATSDIYGLNNLSKTIEIEAESGQSGMLNKKRGKAGKDNISGNPFFLSGVLHGLFLAP